LAGWQEALRHNQHDAEAQRYLGELALAQGLVKKATSHFSHAYSLAPDDKLLKAETSEAVANYYRQQARPMLELRALVACAPHFADAGERRRAAIAFLRAGELAAKLNQIRQAPQLLRAAFENYQLANDKPGMRAAHSKLQELDEDVQDLHLPNEDWWTKVPWPRIRLAIELLVLAAAGGLFYISLR
jgi:tetratricopeptide (TPR) repeat protein